MREDQDTINVKDLDFSLKNSSGIFINLLKFTVGHDPKFEEALKTTPKNAKYTSAEIQNEIIDFMKKTVLKNIVEDHQKNGEVVSRFREKNLPREAVTVENLSTLLCHSVDDKANKRLTGVAQVHDLTAEDITQQILKDLCDLCSWFGSANVVSGCKGGVQMLSQQKLKQIPYTHCLNHQLPLVVTCV
ncbi:unnamed protein product [Lepidochelys kempii]